MHVLTSPSILAALSILGHFRPRYSLLRLRKGCWKLLRPFSASQLGLERYEIRRSSRWSPETPGDLRLRNQISHGPCYVGSIVYTKPPKHEADSRHRKGPRWVLIWVWPWTALADGGVGLGRKIVGFQASNIPPEAQLRGLGLRKPMPGIIFAIRTLTGLCEPQFWPLKVGCSHGVGLLEIVAGARSETKEMQLEPHQ